MDSIRDLRFSTFREHEMDYKEILKDLRKELHSIKARLQSIIYDHLYVSNYAGECLVANERCGLWYINPNELTHSAYFKSTDGHTGEWKFSMRRLNFHLLPLLNERGNLILVDSTRKGKLMPDALLKTVPIWCAVLNYIMFESESLDDAIDVTSGNQINASEDGNQDCLTIHANSRVLRLALVLELQKDNWLLTPPEMVSRSEHAAIVKTIPLHARELRQLGLIDKETLIRKLGRKAPILPLWLYPDLRTQSPQFCPDSFTVCCLTTSYKITPGFVVPDWSFGFPYVQGAGDDHELWASKDICNGELLPSLFWTSIIPEKREHLRLLDQQGNISPWLNESEVIERLNLIYIDAKQSSGTLLADNLDVSELKETGILIGSIRSSISCDELKHLKISQAICLSEKFKFENVPPECLNLFQNFQIESLKKGAKKLREVLPKIIKQVTNVSQENRILIVCDTGSDICVAVALCVLCLHFDLEWRALPEIQRANKDIVKQHLALICEIRRVNPSRNTLQSVNACIMG